MDIQRSDGGSQPWANGRLLSAAQRERKRHRDRVNKSSRRKRDQHTVEGIQAQLEVLAATLQTLQQRLPDSVSKPDDRRDGGLSHETDMVTPWAVDEAEWDPQVLEEASPIHAIVAEEDGAHVLPLPSEDLPVDRWSIAPSTGESAAPVSVQDLFNQLLRQGCVCDRLFICTNEALNQNALIRGIMHGWHTVLTSPSACPLWEVIGRLDRLIFAYSSLITRFCTLRMIHYMLLVGAAYGPATAMLTDVVHDWGRCGHRSATLVSP